MVKQAYVNSGVLKYSRLKEIKDDQWPTLSNVYDELEKLADKDEDKFNRVKDFYYILGSYTHGSNSLFDGHTNVNLKGKIISFDLKPCKVNRKSNQRLIWILFNTYGTKLPKIGIAVRNYLLMNFTF